MVICLYNRQAWLVLLPYKHPIRVLETFPARFCMEYCRKNFEYPALKRAGLPMCTAVAVSVNHITEYVEKIIIREIHLFEQFFKFFKRISVQVGNYVGHKLLLSKITVLFEISALFLLTDDIPIIISMFNKGFFNKQSV